MSILPGIPMLTLLWYLIRRRDLTVTAAALHFFGALWIGWVLSAILTHPVAEAIAPEMTWKMVGIIAGIGLVISPLMILLAALVMRVGRLLPGTGSAIAQPSTDMSAPAT